MGFFKLITIAGTSVLLQELVFKMLKLLNEQICVILINKINQHYCFTTVCDMCVWWLLHYFWRSATKMIDLNDCNTRVFVFCKN